jgi:hypothetical protein
MATDFRTGPTSGGTGPGLRPVGIVVLVYANPLRLG